MSDFPISTIIVTYNHADYLPRCLDTLIPAIENLGGEVIIVDNRSDDESVEIIRRYAGIRLYVNQERQGFAANSNFGMAMAQGRYLLLLNPDTEILPGAIGNLIDFMDNHSEVGLCGAQLLFPDGSVQPSPRRFPTIGAVIARRTPLRVFLRNSRLNRYHLMLDMDYTKTQEVDWLLGACLCVRRQALYGVGPLDEGFFLYVEDIDWARRMRAAGWKIYYVPTSQIIHHHLAVSDKKFLSYRTWVHTLSMIRYTRKHLLPPIPWLSITKSKQAVWSLIKEQKD